MNYVEQEIQKLIYKKIKNLSVDDYNKLLIMKNKAEKEEKNISNIVGVIFTIGIFSTFLNQFSSFLCATVFFASMISLSIPIRKILKIKKIDLEIFDFLNIDFLQEYKNILLEYTDKDKDLKNINKDNFINNEINKIEKMQKSKNKLNKEKLRYLGIIRNYNVKQIDYKLIRPEIDLKQRLLNLDIKVKQ